MARPKTADPASPRSVRINDALWAKARKRAEGEGRTISSAASDLIEGYARGVYDLPVTRTIREFPAAGK